MTEGSKPLIAIVDDDALFRRGLTRLVTCGGFEARAFSSGEDFIACLETTPSFRPACVVLDVQMRGLNGIQVLAHLGSMRPDVPVIFVSAAYEDRLRRQAMSRGAAAFFEKPFNSDAFMRALYAIVGIALPPRQDP